MNAQVSELCLPADAEFRVSQNLKCLTVPFNNYPGILQQSVILLYCEFLAKLNECFISTYLLHKELFPTAHNYEIHVLYTISIAQYNYK